MRQFILFLILGFSMAQLSAQDYEFETYTETYQDLEGAFPIRDQFDTNSRFGLNLPDQQVTLFGQTYATAIPSPLGVLGNGTVSAVNFQDSVACYIWGFRNKLKSKPDGQSMLSVATREQDPENLIIVQFSDAGFAGLPDSLFVNFQIWLYQESGDVKIHFGPSNFNDSVSRPQIGLSQIPLDFNDQSKFKIAALTGDAASPSLNTGQTTPMLEGLPENGRVYHFKSKTTSKKEFRQLKTKVYPNPSNDLIHIQSSSPLAGITLISAQGKVLDLLDYTTSKLDVSSLASGIYFLRLRYTDGSIENHQIQIIP